LLGSAVSGAKRRHSKTPETRFHMANVDFHSNDQVVFHIRELRGDLVRRKGEPPTFDDKRSFDLKIDSGVIGVRTDVLAYLMNHYVFASPKSALKDIKVAAQGDQLKLTGKMRDAFVTPFEIVGKLDVVEGGLIRLHPTSVKAGGVQVKGVLKTFGVRLRQVIPHLNANGVRVEGDDMIMNPTAIAPPPGIEGTVTGVKVSGNEVLQIFGNPAHVAVRGKGAGSMSFKGGTIRFGKLTMDNADLTIVGEDGKAPFDFSIDHYNRQLVAGYSKSKPNFGLLVYMPDYAKLRGSK
jgi:hypothetical protein